MEKPENTKNSRKKENRKKGENCEEKRKGLLVTKLESDGQYPYVFILKNTVFSIYKKKKNPYNFPYLQKGT